MEFIVEIGNDHQFIRHTGVLSLLQAERLILRSQGEYNIGRVLLDDGAVALKVVREYKRPDWQMVFACPVEEDNG